MEKASVLLYGNLIKMIIFAMENTSRGPGRINHFRAPERYVIFSLPNQVASGQTPAHSPSMRKSVHVSKKFASEDEAEDP